MTRELTPREEAILRLAAAYRAARRAYENVRYHRLNADAMLAEVIDSSRRLLSAAEADD